MADKGIIFSAPMVRALLDNRKTQTRRLMPQQEALHIAYSPIVSESERAIFNYAGEELISRAPYAPGDRLYVREHWKSTPAYDDLSPSEMGGDEPLIYLADDATFNWAEADGSRRGKHRQGMHMPRWASRLWLAVTDVRVQRLQEISEADAVAEGIERIDDPRGTAWKSYETCPDGKPHPHASVPNRSPITSYAELWNSLHTKPGERWEDNPWIVAVSFSVHKGNIDEAGRG